MINDFEARKKKILQISLSQIFETRCTTVSLLGLGLPLFYQQVYVYLLDDYIIYSSLHSLIASTL